MPFRRAVLVVDDDQMLGQTIADILTHHGHETEVKANGSGGISAAETASSPFAVALVDLRLPDMDGLEVVSKLHEISPMTQIVILTGNATLDSAIQALRDDSFDYLVKPVTPEQLVDTVQKGFERSKHRQAEEELLKDRERFQRLVEALSDVVTVVLPDGTIQYQSPSARRVLGFPPGKLLETPFLELVHADDRDGVSDVLSRALQDAGLPHHFEFRLRGATDDWILMEGVARTLHETSASPIVVTSRDITERRRLERALNQSQKMESVGRLAGGVAHDFNNQLTAILGGLGIASLHHGIPAEVQQELSEVRAAAERAARLTRQLLLFSRNKLEERQFVDVNSLVSEMAGMLRRLIPEHIGLEMDLADELPHVHADPTQLEQVFLNFVVNARDALGAEGGRIVLRTWVEADGLDAGPDLVAALDEGPVVVASVEDDGPGMDEETRERIFEPFFTTKEGAKGTGLGLATSYGIITRAGGAVRVESEPDRGSRFDVFLPAAAAGEAPSREAVSPDESPDAIRGRGEVILVIEDDAAVRKVVHRFLEEGGYVVLPASDARTALDHVQGTRKVDLILSDLVLENATGPEIVAAVRTLRPELPVLFMTGYARGEVLIDGAIPFEADVVSKPIDFDDLMVRVRRTLRRSGRLSSD